MKWEFECYLNDNPVPHRTPTINRWGTAYKGKRETAYIKDLSEKIKEQYDLDKAMFGEEPIQISYEFGFMPAKSWSKKKKADAFDGIYRYDKPDLDNIMKSTTDILMKNNIITDDQYIVKYGDVIKIFTEKPQLKISIQTIR